jgi:hypothetical protein
MTSLTLTLKTETEVLCETLLLFLPDYTASLPKRQLSQNKAVKIKIRLDWIRGQILRRLKEIRVAITDLKGKSFYRD